MAAWKIRTESPNRYCAFGNIIPMSHTLMDPSSAAQNEPRHLDGWKQPGLSSKRARQIRRQRSKQSKHMPKFNRQKNGHLRGSQDHPERIGLMFDGD